MRNTPISDSTRTWDVSALPTDRVEGRRPSGIRAGRKPAPPSGVTLTVRVTETVTETGTARVAETGVIPRGRAQELEIRSTCSCCRWVGVWGREFTPRGGQAAAPRARLAARPPGDSSTDLGKLRPRRGPVVADRTDQTPHPPVPLRRSSRPVAPNRPAFALCGPGSQCGAPGARSAPKESQGATQAATRQQEGAT